MTTKKDLRQESSDTKGALRELRRRKMVMLHDLRELNRAIRYLSKEQERVDKALRKPRRKARPMKEPCTYHAETRVGKSKFRRLHGRVDAAGFHAPRFAVLRRLNRRLRNPGQWDGVKLEVMTATTAREFTMQVVDGRVQLLSAYVAPDLARETV